MPIKMKSLASKLRSGSGVKIKEIAEIIAKRFDKKIKWLTDKPAGDPKGFDMSRAKYGFHIETNLETGINYTIDWFLDNKEVIDKECNVFR